MHAMKAYEGVEVHLHLLLISAREWSISRPTGFTPGEGHPLSTE
jgi:hypothetical protein